LKGVQNKDILSSMNNFKVSILIPLYNAENYIAETIESCLNQTYQDIEIIIIDDGSTDGSLKIARTYEMQYENIKVEVQNNAGASAARNRAYELSSGKYIQYLDADDLLHPDKILIQMDVLKKLDKKTLAFGRWGTFKKNVKSVEWKDLSVNKNYDDTEQFLIDLWGSGRSVVVFSWLTPRELIEESGGWNIELSTNDDGDFFARVVSRAKRVLFFKNSKGYYRKDNDDSLSSKNSKESLRSALLSYETYINIMKDKLDKPYVRKSLALFYSNYLYHVYPDHGELVQKVEEKLRYLGYSKPITENTKNNRMNYFLSKIIGIYGIILVRLFLKRMKLI
jgi:glycosyltransferase involved in cell wall biosynthesis